MLGIRVTKYYHATKIRDEKEELNSQYLHGNPSTNKRKNYGGKSRELSLSERNYKTSKTNYNLF
jgi:hypothetical protein